MAIQDTTTINAIILVVNQLATFVIQLVNTWPFAIDNRQKDKGEYSLVAYLHTRQSEKRSDSIFCKGLVHLSQFFSNLLHCVSMCKPLPYLDETFYILVHFHLQYIFLHLQCIVGTIANRIPIVSKVVCDN